MKSIPSLVKQLSLLLLKKQLYLTTAESCTGGLIASHLTDLPGSSLWFERGFVTYSNLSKQQMLGVPEDLIAQYGAVSDQVAVAMAVGALDHSAADISMSVTGIAGPDGGSTDKPVGTVHLAWAQRNRQPNTLKLQLSGNRQEIRLASCQHSLEGVLSLINKIS